MNRRGPLRISTGVGLLGIAGAFLLFSTGCTKTDARATRAHGKVTLNGEPVPGGMLFLQFEDSTSEIKVPIDGNGNFVAANVPTGAAKVKIDNRFLKRKTRDPQKQGFDKNKVPEEMEDLVKGYGGYEGQGNETPTKYVELPAKYRSYEKSGLSLEFSAGKNVGLEVALEK